jgi:hypothetical protein
MGSRLPDLNEGSMLTTRVRILLVCSTLGVLSACSSSPTTPTPAPAASAVTVTLVQGTSTAIAGAPVRLAFDAVRDPCRDTADCLPSGRPWTQFRVQIDGAAFEPLPLERLGTELRFQGSAGGYLFLVDSLRVEQPGEWVATVVVRRGLEV